MVFYPKESAVPLSTQEAGSSIILKSEKLEVAVSATGAGLRFVRFLKNGNDLHNSILSFLYPDNYRCNSLYAGAVLAPAAGRIPNGQLFLNSSVHILSRNENEKNHLHGGFHSLSFREWKITDCNSSCITFLQTLPHGLDGYPGNREFKVTYRVLKNTLSISLYMESDLPTYANLSHHAYYNLNGFKLPNSPSAASSGLSQYFQTSARQVLYNDALHIPQAVAKAQGPFDFSRSRLLEKQLFSHKNNPQLQMAKGYNHYFLTDSSLEQPACSLCSADKQIKMHLFTDAPAFILYSGGFIENDWPLISEDGSFLRSYPGCSIAIEPTSLPMPLFSQTGVCSQERNIYLVWE